MPVIGADHLFKLCSLRRTMAPTARNSVCTRFILRRVFFRSPDVEGGEGNARQPVSRVLSRAEARAMAIHLGRPSPGASRDRPGRLVRKPTAAVWTAARPYMVLLPEGFAVPCPSPGPRCALTAPFHPCPLASRPERVVCSLWHFPWGYPRRALPGSVLPWSPDFPPPREGSGGHPAVWRTLVTRRWRRGQGFPRNGGRGGVPIVRYGRGPAASVMEVSARACHPTPKPRKRSTKSRRITAASTIWSSGTYSLAAWLVAPSPGPKLTISIPSPAKKRPSLTASASR